MRIKLFTIIYFAGFLMVTSCLKDEQVKISYQGFTPVDRPGDWIVSSPQAENVDNQLLESAYRLIYKEDRYVMARSLLVVRNGKLIAEAYPHDPGDIDMIRNIQSCAKSFTALMTGIAISNQALSSVEQKLSDIYPEFFEKYPEKGNITIENALTMRTGLDFDNSEHTKGLYETEDSSIEYVLSLPKLYEPGIVVNYNDGAPQLISGAIQKATGITLEEYARTYLFAPMGIHDIMWEKASDGVTFGAFSLYIKPRDFAKIGQLLLQNGKWNDQQVIDSAWIASATSPKVNIDLGGASYGYYFWIFPAYEGFMMEGHGGQFLAVYPGKNLVIVYTAWPYTSGDFFDRYTELTDLIYKSCD